MWLAWVVAIATTSPVFGTIIGGEGNHPISDPGLPTGAIEIMNHPARVAWWEDPPFGGGHWHGDYRGDVGALNALLAEFGKLEGTRKRVVVCDGAGQSFWLNPNSELAKEADARVDWKFAIWQTGGWEKHCDMPVDLRRENDRECDQDPPAEIQVYTDRIKWVDVSVPEGVTVIDNRLVAHGFSPADGYVLAGHITDLGTGQPLTGQMRLARIDPQSNGRSEFTLAAEVTGDAQGHWALKALPAGLYRVVIASEGYVPRIAGYTRSNASPRWQSYDCGLARSATVTGRVTDEVGAPLSDVAVRLTNVTSAGDGTYDSIAPYATQSDPDGRFRFEQVPAGSATVWAHKPGYCYVGPSLSIDSPTADLTVRMKEAVRLRVTVDFTAAQRPQAYVVKLVPEGGEKPGSWGGENVLDDKNQCVLSLPPGRYVLEGYPVPSQGDHKTQPVTIELERGVEKQVTLFAR